MRINVVGYGAVGKAQANNPEFLREKYANEDVPSNIDQLINAFHGQGLNPLLFEAFKKYNLRLQK